MSDFLTDLGEFLADPASWVGEAGLLNRTGDHLLLATDALAEWLVRAAGSGDAQWRELTTIEHPRVFQDWVDRLREAGAMRNDDVTLLRARITPADAGVLVVCR